MSSFTLDLFRKVKRGLDKVGRMLHLESLCFVGDLDLFLFVFSVDYFTYPIWTFTHHPSLIASFFQITKNREKCVFLQLTYTLFTVHLTTPTPSVVFVLFYCVL